MSQNNIPTNLPSVEKLAQRLMAAERSQQKEIRISIQEARELTVELSMLTSKMSQTIAEIHKMMAEMQQSNDKIEIKFDGGGFSQG
jgi:uncharacterized coiled-coil DUF342 family protein